MAPDFMVKQARLRSNVAFCVGWLVLLTACQPTPNSTAVPRRYVSADQPGWQQREGRLRLRDTLFSGWQYQLGRRGDTLFVGAFREGRAEGAHRWWFQGGRLQEVRHFKNGWQQGQQRGWFANGRPRFVYHFRDDVYDGELREWYENGRPARWNHYVAGQESGPQRQWFADGTLKMNYTVRQGRTYGFTGVKNCSNVADTLLDAR